MKTLKNKLCILFSAILAVACGVFGVSALQPQKAEAEATPAVTIESNNLSYSDSLYLIYAVSNEGFDRKQNQIQLLFWEEPQEEYTYGTQDSVATTNDKATIKGKDCLIYYSRGLAAKEMTTDLYARAYVNIDGMAYYSEVSKFSVWDYAYTMMDEKGVDAKTETLLTEMLEYGGAAQVKFNHKTDKLASEPYYKVRVENGTLANGNTWGRYFTGESVTITANPAPEGKLFFYWRDSAGTIVSREASYTISASAHESYTAVYMDADSTAWSQGLSYTLNSDGTSYTVAGLGTCTDLAVSIPAMYNDKPVTSIGNYAFSSKKTITSVVIPDSVTSIGNYAFYHCDSLTSVEIGDSVTSIGEGAFEYCSSLTAVYITDIEAWCNISFGGYYANLLYYAKNLYLNNELVTELVIPDTVTEIKPRAFYNCSSLTSVVIPDSVTSIGNYAFYHCDSLTSVEIGDSVTSIGEGAFYYCSSLTSVVIPDSVTSIGNSAFDSCSSLTSVVIPDSVTSIGNYAFYHCDGLTSVVIPDGVTSIGNYAFYLCYSLKTVYYGGTESEWGNITIGDDNTILTKATRYYYSENEPAINSDGTAYDGNYWHYVDGVPTRWDFANHGHTYTATVTDATCEEDGYTVYTCACGDTYTETIPAKGHTTDNGVCGNCGEAFYKLTAKAILATFTFGENGEAGHLDGSVISSGQEYTDGDYTLTLNDVSSIYGNTTKDAKGNSCLKMGTSSKTGSFSFLVPENAVSVEIYIAKYKANASKVSVNGIEYTLTKNSDDGAYDIITVDTRENRTVTVATVAGGVRAMVNTIVWYHEVDASKGLAYALNGDGESYTVTGIGECTDTELIIPSAYEGKPVTAIGEGAFKSNATITSVLISENITVIGKDAFANCSKLASAEIAEGVTSFTSGAFNGAYSLVNITVAGKNENYQSIDGNLYSKDGKRLVQYAIGKTDSAFTVPDGVTAIGEYAFYSAMQIKSVILPEGVTAIGAYAFAWSYAESVSIPESVTFIGKGAFYFGHLTSVEIPQALTSIGVGIFYGCDFTSVEIPDSVTSISDEAFAFCTELTEIVLPDGLTSIGTQAFRNCTALTEIIIPASVTSMGYHTFVNCDSLTIYCEAESDPCPGSMWSPSLVKLPYYYSESEPAINSDGTAYDGNYWHYVDGVVTVWEYVAPTYSQGLAYTLNSDGESYTVTGIGTCTDTDIIIPATYEGLPVTKIGERAFSGLEITAIDIPEGITVIGERAFAFSDELTHITLPSTVTELGDMVFYESWRIVEVVNKSPHITVESGDRGLSHVLAVYNSDDTFTGTKLSNDNGYIVYTNGDVKLLIAYQGEETDLVLPAYITKINQFAFVDYSHLTSVIIGENVTEIGYDAFGHCSGLTSVVIPDNVTYIGEQAFYACSNLRNVILSENATYLGRSAFGDCYKLEEITIPASITRIGESPFRWCESLKNISVAEENEYYQSIDGNLYTKDGTKLICYTAGKTDEKFIVPEGVAVIGTEAFSYAKNLVEVVLPDGVVSIDWDAFYNCKNLLKITIPATVTSIGGSVFSGCDSLSAVYITDIKAWCNISFGNDWISWVLGTRDLYLNDVLVTNLVIPETVTEIKQYAFRGFSSLTNITLPDSVTSIGSEAFCECSNLTSVTIPDSVTSIGNYAFYDCDSLESITFEDPSNWYRTENDDDWENKTGGVMEDLYSPSSNVFYFNSRYYNSYWYTFEYSQGLAYTLNEDGESYTVSGIGSCTDTDIIIPATYEGLPVTKIGERAFWDCSSLTSVVIGDSVTSIGNYAFAYCTNLTSVVIPDSVTSIGDNAFRGCSGLTSVVIPDSVTSIGNDAFDYCSSLTAVYITDIEAWYNISFANIYANPLYCAKNLYVNNELVTELVIPDSVTSIGQWAFYKCSSLTAVYITDIEAWCNISFGNSYANPLYCAKNLYVNNELVTELVIPDTVTEIKPYAFAYYSSLTSVVIPDSVTSIGNQAFYECSSLTSVVIGDSVTSIGERAFWNCSSLTSVVIPDSVTSIGNYAFYKCSSLTSVVIPDSVTSIGEQAFYNCSSLKTVYYGGTESEWGNITIGTDNEYLTDATRYYYSENEPAINSDGTAYDGNYWHFVDGVVTVWDFANHGHTYTATVTDATCEEDGYTVYTCACGDTYTETIPAKGHTTDNGVCGNCGVQIGEVAPEEPEVIVAKELDFSNGENRTSQTTAQQVWEQNGVKLTNNKAKSTSNVADYVNPARFYKSSQIIIECAGMTKIEFACGSTTYATALQSSIVLEGVTVTVSGKVVTVEFEAPVDSYTIESLTGGQVRVNSLTVYAKA